MVQSVSASADPGARVPRFEIHADHCAALLAKIIGLFAAQQISVSNLLARRSCAGMWVAVEADVDAIRAERIADRLRMMVGISAVIFIPTPGSAEQQVGAAPAVDANC